MRERDRNRQFRSYPASPSLSAPAMSNEPAEVSEPPTGPSLPSVAARLGLLSAETSGSTAQHGAAASHRRTTESISGEADRCASRMHRLAAVFVLPRSDRCGRVPAQAVLARVRAQPRCVSGPYAAAAESRGLQTANCGECCAMCAIVFHAVKLPLGKEESSL